MGLIEVSNITHRYPERTTDALHNVSFNVQEGDWVSIVGANGSGKSTLVKLLGAIMKIQEGTITINSIDVIEDNWYKVHESVGMVFQNPDNQFVGATVEDDIAFGLENHGVSYEEMHTRVDEVLNAVNMMHMKHHEPHHLSGGQKQRIAIAGILALHPKIIILDEATAMLDPEGRKEILSVIKQLQEQYLLTIIAITHDLEETIASDHIIVMGHGEIQMQGTPEEIFSCTEQLEVLNLDLPFAMKVNQAINNSTTFITDEELVRQL